MTTMEEILQHLGDSTTILKKTEVNGGDINEAFHVQTERQAYFVKQNQNVPSHFFQVEARGLELIRDTGTVHVPEVYYYDTGSGSGDSYLVMEHIKKEASTPLLQQRLGERLARMHRTTGGGYGFHQATFVGELDQINEMVPSWVEYYRTYRLLPQFHLAEKNGRLPAGRRQRLSRLIERLDSFLPNDPGSSLLHGDLWGGNWIPGPDETPYLIDPSVLYGDRLMDLSFTELFGGYSGRFYDSYKQEAPLPDYYEEVKPLYQLFYLLVHLNLFGEAYGSPVDRILSHYIDTKG
ncbi:fructosamine kinase family protein [Salimicrobium sp. PL1-032A]|uniref:fructosamine kinase family protein n=1 Tax=Salimicrobium sp. PL1-032A TaxID=3095364 RepID=UPI003260FF4A